MKVLIPLLGEELKEEFIEKLIKLNPEEIILLLVIDTISVEEKPFGFVGTEIMQGNLLLEDLKKLLEEKKFNVETITEWGQLKQKIKTIAQRGQVDKIVFKRLESKRFFELIKELTENTEKEIQVM